MKILLTTAGTRVLGMQSELPVVSLDSKFRESVKWAQICRQILGATLMLGYLVLCLYGVLKVKVVKC